MSAQIRACCRGPDDRVDQAPADTDRAVRVRNLSAMAVTVRDLSGRTGRQTLVMGVMTLAVAELLANVRY